MSNRLTILSAVVLLVFGLAVSSFSTPVFAKAMQKTNLQVFDYITHMKASRDTRALTLVEKDLLYFSQFAFEAVDLKTVSVRRRSVGTVGEMAKHLELPTLVEGFEKKISLAESWGRKRDSKVGEKILEDRDRLQKLLNASKFSWAWALRQIGEVEASRSLLEALFETEYQRVMSLENAVYGFRGTPLGKSEKILWALNSMSDPKAQALQNEKMRKMKTHISRLPVSRIET